jgi:hypothetical protein
MKAFVAYNICIAFLSSSPMAIQPSSVKLGKFGTRSLSLAACSSIFSTANQLRHGAYTTIP